MPDAKVIVFNAAAVLITGAAVVGLLRSLLFTPTSVPCSERYITRPPSRWSAAACC